ncbi:hypothetical protein TBLA_0B03300 [Henningerozyma blattae CBS 6284]|uniref:N-acetylglucosaminylphosphatidylinositol deacetylase n=1 Tax=Henningerozyma blattae (strain ATCC 34711 / CBS 6284 / DSM 70876 / NBRC 10599 / NRRL Y-10934 / UCD 77-7) TaxID=1071380 RepID=I2GYG9_HENB6|nr:hypothetical protein TBLA_0B03300 [Tetrapisispora blattae CBS 6284]CCH59171.1 hypothetical protein TBLA_0B03300 [Tetrapisispora blattae CBS 6284]
MNFSTNEIRTVKLILIFWLIYIFNSNSIKLLNDQSFNYFNKHIQLMSNKQHVKINSLSLIIAHPDDEIMFFSPTLLQLNNYLEKDIMFNVVCLSQGLDSTGSFKDPQRVHELNDSLNLLFNRGSNNEHNRNFKLIQLDYTDGMKEIWNMDLIVDDLLQNLNFTDNGINLLLTFDKSGVSNHKNHLACNEAVTKLLKYSNPDSNLIGIFLNSHSKNFFLKYSFFVSKLFTIIKLKFFRSISLFYSFCFPNSDFLQSYQIISHYDLNTKTNLSFTFFNPFAKYMLSYSTMLNAHESQMVWFRYLWWIFSRFAFINDLTIVN